jgi:hypothetical protein
MVKDMVRFERYHVKTRGRHYEKSYADAVGIKRVYNYTSDIDYMDRDSLDRWVEGLYNGERGEAIIVESALREVEGVQLYVMTCIVFFSVEQCNLYYIRHSGEFKLMDGFLHLMN